MKEEERKRGMIKDREGRGVEPEKKEESAELIGGEGRGGKKREGEDEKEGAGRVRGKIIFWLHWWVNTF